MNPFAKVCQLASKGKVHVAEESERYGYDFEESLLKIEEIMVVENN